MTEIASVPRQMPDHRVPQCSIAAVFRAVGRIAPDVAEHISRQTESMMPYAAA